MAEPITKLPVKNEKGASSTSPLGAARPNL